MYLADVKAQLEGRNYYYPDVLVTCNLADRETPLYKRFPKLIVEVLSPSTEAFDRGDKFIDDQSFESLEEYVLINPKHRRVEVFRRAEGGLMSGPSPFPKPRQLILKCRDSCQSPSCGENI